MKQTTQETQEVIELASPRPRRRIRPWVAVLTVLILAGGFSFASERSAPPASAASLSCGQVFMNNNGADGSFTHTCYGKGVVKYTVNCLIGDKYIFTHKWTGSLTKRFEYHCGWATSPLTTSYQIIG